jgi:hypothetical protein
MVTARSDGGSSPENDRFRHSPANLGGGHDGAYGVGKIKQNLLGRWAATAVGSKRRINRPSIPGDETVIEVSRKSKAAEEVPTGKTSASGEKERSKRFSRK